MPTGQLRRLVTRPLSHYSRFNYSDKKRPLAGCLLYSIRPWYAIRGRGYLGPEAHVVDEFEEGGESLALPAVTSPQHGEMIEADKLRYAVFNDVWQQVHDRVLVSL